MTVKLTKRKNAVVLKKITSPVKTVNGLSTTILILLEGCFKFCIMSSNAIRLDGLNLKDMGAESENTEEEHADVTEQKEQHETRTWGQVDVSYYARFLI